MIDHQVVQALDAWGFAGASVQLVAERENKTYRLDADGKTYALRIHRAGLRTKDELNSELLWTAMLSQNGINVSEPIAAKNGELFHTIDGAIIDVQQWLYGIAAGENGQFSNVDKGTDFYHKFGRSMAKMHLACDKWQEPENFTRHHWDKAGLLGDNPLWGRFWENPTLDDEQKNLIETGKTAALKILDARDELDYGLIHADLVPENILVNGTDFYFIDFDDGGYGYRLFDIATTLNKLMRSNDYETKRDAFIEGYLSARKIDLTLLPLFQMLRAFTYLGWIIPRIEEAGSKARNQRFIKEACQLIEIFLEENR